MADYTKCDGGCDTMSPDSKGSFIANSWTMVKISDRHGKFKVSRCYIFCDDCFKKIKDAMKGVSNGEVSVDDL